MRVSKSATGSVKLILYSPVIVTRLPRRCQGTCRDGLPFQPLAISSWPLALVFQIREHLSRLRERRPIHLPRRLGNAGNLALQRQAAEAQAAEAELAQISARASADAASVAVLGRELGLPVRLGNFCCCSHVFLSIY